MRLISVCVKLLSVAAVAMAAPPAITPRQAGAPVPFPPESLRPKPISLQEAVAAMKTNASTQASVAASVAEANNQVSIQAGCRATIYRRWGTLSPQERTNYVNGVRCLMNRPRRGIWNGARNLYDEIVWVHAQMNGEIHLSDIFLPWHRYYLFMFRELLRTECGFNGPHPWWKETNNAGNFPASDIFSSQWYGALPQRDGNGNGRCITNGAFAGITYQGGCVARGENKGITNQVSIQNEEVCHGQEGNTFSQHSFCNERRNHALFHNGFGPTMSNSAISPADPIFFLHHSYVDWQWKRWQNVASWRWSTISGCADRRSPCTPLTRDTILSSRGLFRNMRVGELLDSEGTATCYTYDLLV